MKALIASRLLFSVLALLVVTTREARGDPCDPVQLSFDLCDADVYCRESMYIDENMGSLVVFEFLYSRLFVTSAHQTQIEAALCILNNTDFNTLWTYTMSMYRYCNHINQYFDGADNACFCKADKTCKYARPDDLEFRFSTSDLFMYAMFLISLFAVAAFIVLYRPLFKMMKAIQRTEAIEE